MNTIVLLSSDSVLLGQLQAAFARKAADMHVVLARCPRSGPCPSRRLLVPACR